jgi:4-hydroxybenzoate polyprenyltransferase
MGAIKTLADIIFISRPVLWIPVWAFALFGYSRGLIAKGDPIHLFAFSPEHIHALLGMLIFSGSVGCVYVLNQIADYEVDKSNEGFSLLGHGNVSRKAAWVSMIAFGCLSVIIPVFEKPALCLFSVAAIIIGVMYSFKPFFLSGRPAADFITNAVGFGIVAFGAGWYCSGAHGWGGEFWKSAAPYFLLMCGGSISSTLPDIAGDAGHGKRTTAVFLGAANAHLLAAGCIALAVLCAVIEKDLIALICAAASLPLYVVYVFHKTQKLMEATYKVGGVLCMICAACLFPAFAGAAILVFLLTMGYFRIRFGVQYPSLLPAGEIHRQPEQKNSFV